MYCQFECFSFAFFCRFTFALCDRYFSFSFCDWGDWLVCLDFLCIENRDTIRDIIRDTIRDNYCDSQVAKKKKRVAEKSVFYDTSVLAKGIV